VQDGSSVRLIRYLPHAIVATLLVAVVPALAVITLQRNGLASSLVLSIALGAILSVATATGGSALWMRHRGSRDIVFADLMLWGLFRRLRVERYVADMKRLVDGGGFALGSELTPEKQIEVLTVLARALETRDPYTHGHSRRVARHSYMIAKAMKLSRAEAELIRTAGAVHDVGKVHVPYDVLTKPGKLTDEEFAAIKAHSSKGGELVSQVGNDKLTAIVRHHHERLDGGGYPDRLRGEDIPLGARIIAVADTFDAITSTRSYRGASRHSKAIEILRKEAGTQLDADAVHAFLSYYRGRRAVAWWTTLWTMPQRLVGNLGSSLGGAGGSSLAGTAAAVSAAVIAGAALSPGAIIRVEPSATEVANSGSHGESGDTIDTGAVSSSGGRQPGSGGRRASQSEDGSDHGRRGGSPDDTSGSDGDGSGSDGSGSGGGSSGSGGSTGSGGSGSGSGGSGDGGLVEDTVDTVDDTVDGVVDVVTGDDGSSGSSGSGSSGSDSDNSGPGSDSSGTSGSGTSGSGTSGSGTSGSSGSSGSGGGGLLGGLLDTVGGVTGGLGL
jgi:HD-GYP domain-containing protein (c-di-GMP phosphodiesterase class II)